MLDEQAFAYVRRLVYDAAAIVVEPGKDYLVQARLAPVAKQAGFVDLETFVSHLRASPRNGLHQQVVEAMTTNETMFFRDGQPFELLRQEVVPRLLTARRAARSLTVWCGASSTGQEPYSIAMLLRESFPELARWSVRILATDLNTAVLERARRATYSDFELRRGMPEVMQKKYFLPVEGGHRVRPEIAEMVQFRPLNLTAPWPPLGTFDVVFLRNVLIYFDLQTKKTVLGKVHEVLSSDGVLFLGGAESTMNLDDRFKRLESPQNSGVAYVKSGEPGGAVPRLVWKNQGEQKS